MKRIIEKIRSNSRVILIIMLFYILVFLISLLAIERIEYLSRLGY